MDVKQQETDTGTQVVQERPQQANQHKLHQRMRNHGPVGVEIRFGAQRAGQQINKEREGKEQGNTRDPVQDRDNAGNRQSDLTDIKVFWSFLLHSASLMKQDT